MTTKLQSGQLLVSDYSDDPEHQDLAVYRIERGCSVDDIIGAFRDTHPAPAKIKVPQSPVAYVSDGRQYVQVPGNGTTSQQYVPLGTKEADDDKAILAVERHYREWLDSCGFLDAVPWTDISLEGFGGEFCIAGPDTTISEGTILMFSRGEFEAYRIHGMAVATWDFSVAEIEAAFNGTDFEDFQAWLPESGFVEEAKAYSFVASLGGDYSVEAVELDSNLFDHPEERALPRP